MSGFITTLVILLIIAIVVIVVLAKLYRRATREVSLVKTGIGGKRVVMDGGTLAIPFFHEVSQINMRTLKLAITRSSEAALITRDRLRVDVSAEFYVAVQASEEGVGRAAQTLGSRTFQADQLREIIEGKLIDALRAVAAQMTMDELHENRVQFVKDVRALVADELLKNGLELETVSLTALDQTPFEALDENNAFNAVGLRKLTEVISKSKKERAEIEADAEVAVRLSSMEAARRRLEIERDEEQARISQQQEIETLRAAQTAEIAKQRADSERESEQARIAKEQQVRAAEISRERALREAEIAKDKELEAAEILKERELEIANQERQIMIAQKSEQESQSRAAADSARAEAAKAAESIITTRQVAEAERLKQVALIEAQQKAETEATRMRLVAAAEKEATIDHAAAQREASQAEADSIAVRAEAKLKELLAQAEGQRAIIDAENALEERATDLKVDLARLEALPRVVAEMVKPAEKIESIKIHQVSGIGTGPTGGGNGTDKPVVNQALDSILGLAVQLPTLKKLGEELGVSMESGLNEAVGKNLGKITGETEPKEKTLSASDNLDNRSGDF